MITTTTATPQHTEGGDERNRHFCRSMSTVVVSDRSLLGSRSPRCSEKQMLSSAGLSRLQLLLFSSSPLPPCSSRIEDMPIRFGMNCRSTLLLFILPP
ncbi:hypothetical protein ZWY2020_057798 [Hordeum vulgare]|nr:hypothetical protein ZWY2020_057798 [Hordeum vulgare]